MPGNRPSLSKFLLFGIFMLLVPFTLFFMQQQQQTKQHASEHSAEDAAIKKFIEDHTQALPKGAIERYKVCRFNDTPQKCFKKVTVTAQNTNDQTQPPPPSGATGVFMLTVCPHGLGNCGDNANANGGGNSEPLHQQRSVIVTFLNAQSQPISIAQGNLSYSKGGGYFQGTVSSAVPRGMYLIQVKLDGFLSKQIPGIITVAQGQAITLPSISVVSGDINNDNLINILDYNDFNNCFESKFTTSSCINKNSDVNDDGKVDGIDYNLFLRELSVQRGG